MGTVEVAEAALLLRALFGHLGQHSCKGTIEASLGEALLG
eukprot:CAMPEP_0179065118 /NCGR_PEP_ID=MMETSP0796-20121207/28292_1 /TAXON_ID=73915 /ORGANISM="Pyrodinium bahamense, Strain pbaha01" /LENGTH=39 /DNA_ID= /DNA_START= /DNA_END= /DNA_ORIENTATION=